MREVDILKECRMVVEESEEETAKLTDALTNLKINIVEQARKDYIKGALVLIRKYKMPMYYIADDPDAKIFIQKSCPGSKLTTNKLVFWYKDAKRFVTEDPFVLFADPTEVINHWDREAWAIYKSSRKTYIV